MDIFRRRESLIRSLGLVPAWIEGGRLLEFGPGNGFNSLYFVTLKPAWYALVEGNPVAFADITQRLGGAKNTVVYHSSFQSFQAQPDYDLVWAEGCLPHNSNPKALLSHVATFTKPGGVLVVSLVSGVSWLSEIFRRLVWTKYFESSAAPFLPKLQSAALEFYRAHLESLPGRSRPVSDWILDNMAQPMADRQLLGLPQVLETLAGTYEVHGTSPRFLTDWRWYKSLTRESANWNEVALSNYYSKNLNLIDKRFEYDSHSPAFGIWLEETAQQAWDCMCMIQSGDSDAWDDFYDVSDGLAKGLGTVAPVTAASIQAATSVLRGDGSRDASLGSYSRFAQWWGRGQQYVSLVRV